MVSKVYNEMLIQYSDDSGFVHYANETEGSTLQTGLTQKAAFEGFESGNLQFVRFLNTATNDHVFTSDVGELNALRSNSDFVEEGNVFRLFESAVDGSQAVHRFFNTETGFHHYSADAAEIAELQVSSIHSSEGIVGYGGVVDTREAEQVSNQQSTISATQNFNTVETPISGAFNLSVNTIVNFTGSESSSFNGSITAMSSNGEELPEYLNFNEGSGQVFGYTLKEGIGDYNLLVLADDGISQSSHSFVLSARDSSSKAEADAYTEKSLVATMSIDSNSVGGSFSPTSTGNVNLTFGAAATASASTNLEAFKAANPTIDGSGTTIAVLDTGIDLDHPFFGADANGDGISDNIVASADFHGDGNGAQDSDTHGTHVAGIAMSSNTTFPGTAPGANVAAIQVLGASGGSFSGIEAGLQWVLDNRATYNITSVNMSLGAFDNSSTTQLSALSDEIAALKSQGVITFVAAGNSFSSFNAEGVGTPASDPNALAVSALDSVNEGAASYSQRDTVITKVFAPGTGITNAAPGTGAATQTLSGTSMAAPYVAGVSSLIKQLNPNLSVDEFEAFLQQSSSVFSDPATGGDYRLLDVNALGLLAVGGTLPDAPAAPTDDHPDTIGSNAATLPGASNTGSLESGGDKDVFKVSGTAGASYLVDLRGAPSSLGTLTDPFVRILDVNGAAVITDDDGGLGFESSLTYSPTSTGDFYVEVGAFSSSLIGTYQLDVTDVTIQDDHSNSIGINTGVTVGTNLSGDIEVANDVDVFALDVIAGATYTIDQKGFWSAVGNLRDPFLTLKDGSGTVLSQNDDGGFRLESQITYLATNNETIYVEAGAFGGRTGTYEISVGSSGAVVDNDIAGTPGLGVPSITIGTSQSGDLEVGGDKDVFSLSVDAGATYQIDLKGSTSNVGSLTDPLLRVLDLNGEVLDQNDDGGRGFESSLNYTALSTEQIFIEAGAFSSFQTGTYQIDVLQTSISTSSLGDTVGSSIQNATSANLNSIFGGNIDFLGDKDMFQFSLEAGSTYQFDVRGSHSNHGTLWDPQAFLYDENNTLIAQDDDSGAGFESSISYTAADSGNYYLNVMGNIGELSQTSGSYSVEALFF